MTALRYRVSTGRIRGATVDDPAVVWAGIPPEFAYVEVDQATFDLVTDLGGFFRWTGTTVVPMNQSEIDAEPAAEAADALADTKRRERGEIDSRLVLTALFRTMAQRETDLRIRLRDVTAAFQALQSEIVNAGALPDLKARVAALDFNQPGTIFKATPNVQGPDVRAQWRDEIDAI